MRIRIESAEAGRRLDRWLADRHPELTRSRIRRWIDEGRVTVDDRTVKAGHPLKAGEDVVFDPPGTDDEPDGSPPAEDLPIRIVHQDEALIVVDKPPGMVVHPGAGVRLGTLVGALKGLGLSLASAGAPIRPGIVHRLDKGTSGLLVVARTDQAYEALSKGIAARQVRRDYRALVWGDLIGGGEIDLPIARSRADRTRMTVSAGGRPSITGWRVRRRHRLVTDLDLALRTGRTHQIRVHWRHLGHPVFGDPEYGGRSRGRELSPADRTLITGWLSRIDRQALHAARLEFDHPTTGRRLVFEAPLPDDMAALYERVEQDAPSLGDPSGE
jgi:23S rRNA pseudouridine1911/1915/1917 synthase